MEKDLHLKICLRALLPLGCWPLQFPVHQIWKNIHYVYSKILTCYFFYFVVTEYIYIAQTWNKDFFELVNHLSVAVLYVSTVCKGYVLRGDGIARIVQQIRSTEKIILECDDEEVKSIYFRHVRWNTKLSWFFVLVAVITLSPFFIIPSLELYHIKQSGNTTVDLPLPFGSWFPFDKYYYYEWSFALQVIAGMIGGFLTAISDTAYWALMIFAIGQLKIIQYKFRNLNQHARGLVNQGNMTRDKALRCCLNKCILMHQLIISYVSDIDDQMKLVMLIDFGVCSGLISLIGFLVIFTGFGFAQLSSCEYLTGILGQVFIFYWHANEIILESMDIAQAVWDSDFYEYPLHIQKSLQLVIQRAQKPLLLNVGSFYAMSTTTALSIVRGGYSYVALMRQMYN